jgi:hypothetical protein
MKRMFIAAAALSALAACTDPYGRVDPARSALLGAGLGAAGGAIIGGLADDGPRHHHHRRYGYAPRPSYGYGSGYGLPWRW